MAFTLDFHPALSFNITPNRFTYSDLDKNQLGGRRHGFHFTARNREFAPAYARLHRYARAAARSRSRKFFRAREYTACQAEAGSGASQEGRAVGAAIAQG